MGRADCTEMTGWGIGGDDEALTPRSTGVDDGQSPAIVL
jgi:hypothetical protein